ncbi:MAG: hypothetical protein KKG76_07860 [Euryarchaeota archaeon]|nr:hypothetical protein [Euryarchaeota archaeon]
MKKLGLLLLYFIFLINSAHAFAGETSDVDVDWSLDSELRYPAEGDRVKFNFILTIYSDNETNEYLGVFYFFDSPENQSYRPGVSSFPTGLSYKQGESYSAFANYSFDSPGVWTLNYFAMNKDYSGNYTLQEIRDNPRTHKKRIRVLSYYEANSMIISNNSYKVSIIGIIGTFFAFLLGIFLNYSIDRKKLSPKIKVNCSHGFVADFRTAPVRTFSIEAINYGRINVTLSSVGFNFDNNNFYLFNFLPHCIYNTYKKALEKVGFSKSSEKFNLLIINSEIIPLEFPKELLPGKAYRVIKDYDKLIGNLEGKVPKRAFFIDQTGKTYYSNNIEKMFQNKSNKC